MYTYVYIIYWGSFCQVFFKIFHMSYKKVFFACEVFINFPIFIKYMNNNNFLLFFILI